MIDYEKTKLFELLESINFISEQKQSPILQDSNFKFEISNIKSEAFEHFSLNIFNNNNSLFVLDVVKHDQEHFFQNLKQPFGWDGDARERFSEREWDNFIYEKNATPECPIEVYIRVNHLKITDEETVDKIFNSIDLQFVLEDLYQNSLIELKDLSYTNDKFSISAPKEKDAVSLVIDKLQAIKHKMN